MNLAPHVFLVFVAGIKRILLDLLVSFMAHYSLYRCSRCIVS